MVNSTKAHKNHADVVSARVRLLITLIHYLHNLASYGFPYQIICHFVALFDFSTWILSLRIASVVDTTNLFLFEIVFSPQLLSDGCVLRSLPHSLLPVCRRIDGFTKLDALRLAHQVVATLSNNTNVKSVACLMPSHVQHVRIEYIAFDIKCDRATTIL